MKTKLTILPSLILLALLGLTTPAAAVTPEVEIDSITMTEADEIIATFSDNGTGEIEDFGIEGSTDLQTWSELPAAQFTPTGVGTWSVTIPVDISEPKAFFRVVKDGVALTAGFSVPTVTVMEGDADAGILINFTQPFTGTLRYSVDGTPASMVLTNASSVRIPVPTDGVVDDDEPDQLRTINLSLELEGGAGTSYLLGVNSTATLVIEDNDSLWSGTMKLPKRGGEVGMRILRTENDGVVTTCFKTDKGGLIPPAPVGTPWLFSSFELDLATQTFSAAVSGVTIPAESTIYDAQTQVTIVFAAAGEDVVKADRIEGEFVISTSVAGSEHLNIPGRTGTFTIMRSPGRAGESSAPTTTP